jgi:methyltransferase
MVTAYLAFLSLFGAERLAELWISRRNARIALARGAVETGAAHFPWMALLHAAFLPACAAEALLLHFSFHWTAAAAALCAQGLRWWAISALGWRWNVRVLVVPGAEPVRSGPYRFLRHPNYLAVAIEMLCVPLAGGAWICALVFSALNGAMLAVRIPTEEHALYG